MPCKLAREMLALAVDGELEARSRVELDAHLDACAECRRRLDALTSLHAGVRRGATYHRAPAALRERIEAALPRSPEGAARGRGERAPRREMSGWELGRAWAWRLLNGGGLVAAAAMAAVLLAVLPRSPGDAGLVDEAVDDHVRALMNDHAIDVVSSDQHTVKPWFAGRLDFSPPVRDLASAGFPLAGGRVEYLDRRPVAALVYRRHQHVVDVFVWPASPGGSSHRVDVVTRRGINVAAWTADGMTYRAVSDLEPAELRELAALLNAPT
ncbi:MAG TPA: zf-HC2 domain-containing protein [Burkholderiaceae bacterium]|nr:zf-HC2 domain-containing protein [Burkholderiaceae bacterium]